MDFVKIRGIDRSSLARPREQSDMLEVPGSSPPPPVTAPAPASPSLAFKVSSSPSSSVQLPPVSSSFGRDGMLVQPPPVSQGDYDHLAFDEQRDFCRQRGFARGDSKAGLRTRSVPMDAGEQKRKADMADDMDASGTLSGNAIAPWLVPRRTQRSRSAFWRNAAASATFARPL